MDNQADPSKFRSSLRRLAGRWRQLLLLWLFVVPLTILFIREFIPPTYEVISLLRIEPAQPEILAPPNREATEVQNKNYLKTQIGLITSNRVLNPAIADPLVVNLPIIRNNKDPKANLLKKLKVTIIEDTNLIKVALELPNPDEAVTIVQSIVQSYLAQNTDYSRSANRDLMESLKLQLLKLGDEIKLKQDRLRDLNRKGRPAFLRPREMLNQKTATDPKQPTLNKVTPDQFTKLIDLQVQCDLDYLEAWRGSRRPGLSASGTSIKSTKRWKPAPRRSSERIPRWSRLWIRLKNPGS